MHVIVNVSISLNQCKLNTRVSWRLVELTMRYRGIFFLVFVFPHGVRPRQLLCWRWPRWFSTSSDLWLFSLNHLWLTPNFSKDLAARALLAGGEKKRTFQTYMNLLHQHALHRGEAQRGIGEGDELEKERT